MHSCQVFKTSKGAPLKQKGKIPSYLPYYTRQPSLGTGKRQVVNLVTYRSTNSLVSK
jgi:hypothetical protein